MQENKEEKDFESQIYELGYHLVPTVSETDLSQEVAKLQNIITDAHGSIISESFPEMRGLAYEIAKRVDTNYSRFNKAYFGWIKFEAIGSSIEDIDKKLKLNLSVLRFILVKTVRENTMFTPKIVSPRREHKEDGLVKEAEPVLKTPISEEEIDKSIEALIEN